MMKQLPLHKRILLSLAKRIERYVYKRKWTYHDQVVFASRNITDDHCWLSHNKIATMINKRHKDMLGEDWHTMSHKSQDAFRRDNDLDVKYKK